MEGGSGVFKTFGGGGLGRGEEGGVLGEGGGGGSLGHRRPAAKVRKEAKLNVYLKVEKDYQYF